MAPPADRRLASPELIQRAVEGASGWQAVRSLVTDPQDHCTGEVRARMPAEPVGHGLEVVRSKYKPGRKLSTYYRIARARGSVTSHLAVSWHADGTVSLLRSPADPEMPQLARLSDASALAALVETLQHRLLTGPLAAVRVVRYRPGQRHILLVRFCRRVHVYVKTDRDDRGASAVVVARLVGGALARQCPDARVAEPLGHLSGERTSLWWQAEGKPVAGLIARGRSATPIARLVGCAARAIHDGPVAAALPVQDTPWHDVPGVAAATLRAGEHIEALLPPVGRTYRRLVAAVVEELEQLPDEETTVVHGDLKAENLLVHGHLLRVLDFDRAGRGEPAHDLAKFLADLRWWRTSADVAALEEAFRAGYGPCDPVRWQRAELLAALLQLQLAGRRAPLHDSRWPMLVRDRTDRAVQSFARARGR